ncbi:hypothetical protein [Rhizobium sp. S163]|uniref:hypothetical protein n=1 Tax=Rhizobium sp. S163 TaxID=3055039 RepID=UPI0025A997CE|nr:hypothetical protein [Rhizobium sp. S163]MDM9645576.1 hypothetical protein [Rhizobium sp. S163]
MAIDASVEASSPVIIGQSSSKPEECFSSHPRKEIFASGVLNRSSLKPSLKASMRMPESVSAKAPTIAPSVAADLYSTKNIDNFRK